MTAAEKLRALAKDSPTHFTDEDGCPRELDPAARRTELRTVWVEEIAALLEIAERGHAIQFKVRYAKLADMLPGPRRCSESHMAVTVPPFAPILCPECHQTVRVEDDGTGRGAAQLIAHDVNGQPWRDYA